MTDPGHALAVGSPPEREVRDAVRDTPTFRALYAEHLRFVWRNLHRLGVDAGALEDATQDVFLVVHRRLPEYTPDESPKAWLFAILRRVASDHRRRNRRKGGAVGLPSALSEDARREPHRAAARRQACRIVHDFLDQLEDEQREIFVLSELEQMTAPEISRALGIAESRIYSRVRSGRQALKAFVQARHPDLNGVGDG